jgi:hypothetical protein
MPGTATRSRKLQRERRETARKVRPARVVMQSDGASAARAEQPGTKCLGPHRSYVALAAAVVRRRRALHGHADHLLAAHEHQAQRPPNLAVFLGHPLLGRQATELLRVAQHDVHVPVEGHEPAHQVAAVQDGDTHPVHNRVSAPRHAAPHATTNLWLIYPSSFELFEMPGIFQGLALNAPGTGRRVEACDVIVRRLRARTRCNDGFRVPADRCTHACSMIAGADVS